MITGGGHFVRFARGAYTNALTYNFLNYSLSWKENVKIDMII